jgi:hypothetical protein
MLGHMRLPAVTRDIPWRQKLLFGTFGLFGVNLSMGKVMAHRPALFSGPFSALGQVTLRGESPWTIYERELFAGFCAVAERCPY